MILPFRHDFKYLNARLKFILPYTGEPRPPGIRRWFLPWARDYSPTPRLVTTTLPTTSLHQHRHFLRQWNLADVVHVWIQASITQPSVNRRPILGVVSMQSRCAKPFETGFMSAWLSVISSFVVCARKSEYKIWCLSICSLIHLFGVFCNHVLPTGIFQAGKYEYGNCSLNINRCVAIFSLWNNNTGNKYYHWIWMFWQANY